MPEFLAPTAYLVGGLVLLCAGGERLVRNAAHLAASYRVPKVVVGALILGFGTSLPEFGVSLAAALRESPGIAIGNVVGSNIANVGLILGVGALLVGLHVERRVTRSDLPFGLAAVLILLLWIGPAGEVTRGTGVVLLALFLLYCAGSLRHTRRHRQQTPIPEEQVRHPLRDTLWILAGLASLAIGADLLVRGASEVARLLHVSERVIAVSVVAAGTSLPELATTLAAVVKRETDLAVGNVAGSNLFNLLFVLGATAVIHPIPVEPALVERDFRVVALFSILAFPLFSRARRMGRLHGLLLVALYAAYIVWVWGWRT